MRDFGRRLPLQRYRAGIGSAVLIAVLLLLWVPESMRIWGTLAIATLTATLLILLQPKTGFAAKALGHPWLVVIGLMSYSIYLWHWPLIVVARWSVGVNGWSLLPILLAIAVASLLSYRFEVFSLWPGCFGAANQAPTGHASNRPAGRRLCYRASGALARFVFFRSTPSQPARDEHYETH